MHIQNEQGLLPSKRLWPEELLTNGDSDPHMNQKMNKKKKNLSEMDTLQAVFFTQNSKVNVYAITLMCMLLGKYSKIYFLFFCYNSQHKNKNMSN